MFRPHNTNPTSVPEFLGPGPTVFPLGSPVRVSGPDPGGGREPCGRGPAEGQGVQRSGSVLEGRGKEDLERDGALWARQSARRARE
ncbi:hypothetical protein NHX12_022528 [Muraenolepis orangiensis]|uniref:Uncharacterized protein n=1 Tax=Muraenolepis orangiensis TaxID=630683 RepID=A0A9Q0IV57_9TELE|nr:hypothetical protein NHX12_022528 [Muraenolepis orangiensis]